MNNANKGVTISTLAAISQMDAAGLQTVLRSPYPGDAAVSVGEMCLDGPDHRGRYGYSDVLAVEIARQLCDDTKMSLGESLRFVVYTGAVERFFATADSGSRFQVEKDFWVAVGDSRNFIGDSGRGNIPVTAFGLSEFWSTAHFAGTFPEITAAIHSRAIRESESFSGVDLARVTMVNVSAADRRLRARIDDLGRELGVALSGDRDIVGP